MRDSGLIWFGHVYNRPEQTVVRRSDSIQTTTKDMSLSITYYLKQLKIERNVSCGQSHLTETQSFDDGDP